MLVSALVEVGESFGDRRVSPRNPVDTLWLSDWIRCFHLQYDVAHSHTALEVQRQHAKPCFSKIKQPGIVAVLLGHCSSSAHDLQRLSEASHAKESDGFAAEREKVFHKTRGLIKLRNTAFEHLKSFQIIPLKSLDVRVNHPVKWWNIFVAQVL